MTKGELDGARDWTQPREPRRPRETRSISEVGDQVEGGRPRSIYPKGRDRSRSMSPSAREVVMKSFDEDRNGTGIE